MSDVILVEEVSWKNSTLEQSLIGNIPEGWEEFFESAKDIIHEISEALAKDTRTIWPELPNVFNAMYMCPYDNIKCIILGQDPYPTPKTAYGLAFSSYPGASTPASLRNIFKKLREEGFATSTSYLEKWARQGVFLINTALTVPQGCPEKHLDLWEPFIRHLLLYIRKKEKIVWILWGKKAQFYRNFATVSNNHLLEGGHPSPVNTRGDFLDKDYFRPCNKYLESVGKVPIDWNL